MDLRSRRCCRRFHRNLLRRHPFRGLIPFRRCFSTSSLGTTEFKTPPTAIRCHVGSPRKNGPSRRFPGMNSLPAGTKAATCSKRKFGIFRSKIWQDRFRGQNLCLANCYFAHNSLGFPVLLPFFNASSRRPFHPLNRHPDPVAPTWRRPFPHCRVPSAQTPAPRKSLPASISHAILVGPHPCRLDGALDPSYSSFPFRDCSEAFYPASPSQSHEQASPKRRTPAK